MLSYNVTSLHVLGDDQDSWMRSPLMAPGGLVYCSRKLMSYGIDLALLQEVRLKEGRFKIDRVHWYTSDSINGQLGVAMCVSSGLQPHVKEVVALSPRFMMVRLHFGECGFLVFNVHAPHGGRPRQERVQFFSELISRCQDWSGKFPTYGVIVGGDFNARINWADLSACFEGPGYQDETNVCGEDVLHVCDNLNLWPVLPAALEHQWTFKQGNQQRRLDFILISTSCWDHAGQLICRSPEDFTVDVSPFSHHRPIACTVKALNFNRVKGKSLQSMPRKLQPPQIAKAKAILCERGPVTHEGWRDVDGLAELLASNIREAVLEAVKQLPMHRKPKFSWMDGAPWEACESARLVLRAVQRLERQARYVRGPLQSRIHDAKLSLAKNLLAHLVRTRRCLVRDAKLAYLSSLTNAAVSASQRGDHRALWRIIRRAKPRARRVGVKLQQADGTIVTSEEEAQKVWGEYLASLYHSGVLDRSEWQSVLSTIPEQQEVCWPLHLVPSIATFLKDLAGLKSGKAPGPDNISNDLLKQLRDYVAPGLRAVALAAHTQGRWPLAWKGGRALWLPKLQGGLRPNDHRCIVLESGLAKVMQKYLLRGVHSECASFWAPRQFCIGPNAGTAKPLFELREWACKANQAGQSWCFIFFDVVKAYDSVDKTVLRQKSAAMLGPESWAHMSLAAWQSGDWLCLGKDDEWFVQMNKGVKQGDPLAPVSFAMYINDAVLKIQARLEEEANDGRLLAFMSQWYVDDLVVAIRAEYAPDLLRAMKIAFLTVFEELRCLSLVFEHARGQNRGPRSVSRKEGSTMST